MDDGSEWLFVSVETTIECTPCSNEPSIMVPRTTHTHHIIGQQVKFSIKIPHP